MTRIVTYAHRYKRPPRKRKPVAIEGPAITTKSSRRPTSGKTAAELERLTSPPEGNEAARSIALQAANDEPQVGDRHRAEAGQVRRRTRQQRGEAADALWRGLVDQATAKDGKSVAVSSAESVGVSSPGPKPAIVVTAPKRRRDDPHLPMELPLSRKPIERDGDNYKRMKAAMTRRLRGIDE